MDGSEKEKQLGLWLSYHNATGVSDLVFDGMGVISFIDHGSYDYRIEIQPIISTHNLGSGYGNTLKIMF